MMTVLIPVLIVAVLGLVLGALIGLAAKKFEVKTDPRIEEVQTMLPGANCGGCGHAGCADMAQEIVLNEVDPSSCPVCSAEQAEAISKFLGRSSTGTHEKKVAVVFCSGSHTKTHWNAKYNGLNDCRSASVGNGTGKDCRFGCLGFGACANACPFGAIEIRDGLAVVHPDVCRGCGKCEAVCPRKLIRLVPVSVKVHVFCNSLDKPQVRRKKCTAGCLSCRKCVRIAPEHVAAQGFFVRTNCNNPLDPAMLDQIKCPTGSMQTMEEHLRQVLGGSEEVSK